LIEAKIDWQDVAGGRRQIDLVQPNELQIERLRQQRNNERCRDGLDVWHHFHLVS
jgi:hypothetical protein